jgi:site-specific DNA recombinase
VKRVARVPAIELEKLVVEAVRARLAPGQTRDELSDREAVERYVERIIVRPDAVDIESRGEEQDCIGPISLPWQAHVFVSVKGVLHQPDEQPTLAAEARDAILLAVAKARLWIDDLASGRIQSFAEIARSEGKVERHVRFLAPLVFLPPRVLAAIANGTFHQDVTVTTLARTVTLSWSSRSESLATGC